MVVAEALSDLVIYTGSVKFVNFSHSTDNQNYFENTSMTEKKARKLAKASGKMLKKNVEIMWRENESLILEY